MMQHYQYFLFYFRTKHNIIIIYLLTHQLVKALPVGRLERAALTTVRSLHKPGLWM